MIGKANWKRHLRAVRKRELNIVFSLLPERFEYGLEIGAGDGYQTGLIAPRMKRLISSDVNIRRLKDSPAPPNVTYCAIDADAIQGMFDMETFDFIFSSSVIEHLREPAQFLRTTRAMLMPNGYAVHIVPSRTLKVFYILLYYPDLFLLICDRLIGKLKGKPVFRGAKIDIENNVNLKEGIAPPRRQGRLKRFLFPVPHGNFRNNREEYIAYGKDKWNALFRDAGYSIHSYMKGPVFSGYGFGFNKTRKLFEQLGLSSEHIYILKKSKN